MVTPFNEPDDLQARLKFLGPNQDQWNLDDRLLDAALEMDSMIGRTVEEQLKPSVEDQTDFSFAYSNLFEVVRVEIVSPRGTFDQEVDASNYTVTKNPTRGDPTNISFDQTWAEDNLFSKDYRLRVIYVPELYARLELKLAKWDISVDSYTQTGDDETASQAEKARKRAQSLKKNINRTNQNLGDFRAGRNLAANYNFPGNR
jgi:hypothetical protein